MNPITPEMIEDAAVKLGSAMKAKDKAEAAWTTASDDWLDRNPELFKGDNEARKAAIRRECRAEWDAMKAAMSAFQWAKLEFERIDRLARMGA